MGCHPNDLQCYKDVVKMDEPLVYLSSDMLRSINPIIILGNYIQGALPRPGASKTGTIHQKAIPKLLVPEHADFLPRERLPSYSVIILNSSRAQELHCNSSKTCSVFRFSMPSPLESFGQGSFVPHRR
jgi:hypothetical protein